LLVEVLGLGVGLVLAEGLGDGEEGPVPPLVVGVADGWPDGPVFGLLRPVVGLLPCVLEVPPPDGPVLPCLPGEGWLAELGEPWAVPVTRDVPGGVELPSALAGPECWKMFQVTIAAATNAAMPPAATIIRHLPEGRAEG
jgi:hypothetical protein